MNKQKIYLSTVVKAIEALTGQVPDALAARAVDDPIASRALGIAGCVGSAAPLRPILENIGRMTEPHRFFVSPTELTLDDALMPIESQMDIKPRVDALKKALDAVHVADDDAVTARNLIDLLDRHAATIAWSKAADDVPVNVAVRLACAIAICMQSTGESERPFLLIGGDMSGIQAYLYQVVAKFAGKNLKGRSFYINLLSDAIVRSLTGALDLTDVCVVYNSGGGFYLLAPNTSDVLEAFATARRSIERHIFDAHTTALASVIDAVPLTIDEVKGGNGDIVDRWRDLFLLRDRSKQRKWATLAAADYDKFFCPVAVNSDRVDNITGEDLRPDEPTEEVKEIGLTSKLNAQQIELGKELRKTDLIAITSNKTLAGQWSKQRVFCINPANLGYHYCLFTAETRHYLDDAPDGAATVLHLNNPVPRYDGLTHCRTFYGGNRSAGTFEDMCENKGLTRLGVLRMDVDNLGSIFATGLDRAHASLARYATLSRALDTFFSGYINTLVADVDKSGKNSSILYSGGDDLFIVGDWEIVINIAHQIHKKFEKYTAKNPGLSISGGMELTKAKFPIISGARLSAKLEDLAKDHSTELQEKNSFALLDTALNWDTEFPAVKALVDELAPLTEKDYLDKSFLQKVMNHALAAKFENHKVKNVSIYWHLSYDITRMIERSKNRDIVKPLLNDLLTQVTTPKEKLDKLGKETVSTLYHPLELLALACRWTELKTRKQENH